MTDDRLAMLARLGAIDADYVDHRLHAADPDAYDDQDEQALVRAVVELHEQEPDLFHPEASFSLKIRRQLLKKGK